MNLPENTLIFNMFVYVQDLVLNFLFEIVLIVTVSDV